MEIALTTMSPKGQVVIPQSIRDGASLRPGEKFAVYNNRDMIIFKKISLPTVEDFKAVCKWGRRFAKERGITPEDVLEDD